VALPTRDQLPDFMARIAAHLVEKGMPEPHAVATAVQTARKFCEEGDTNWPGEQHINGGSRADACRAVAEYEAAHGATPAPDAAAPDAAAPEPAAPASADAHADAVTDAAFDADPSQFSDDEWRRSCVLDRGPEVEAVKDRFMLPVREPDGTVNRHAVHAAAGGIRRLNGVPHAALVAAAQALVELYATLAEPPPDFVTRIAAGGTAVAGAAASAHAEQRARPETGSVEERAAPQDAPPPRIVGNKLVGLIPYNVTSHNLGGWVERIAPGALANATKDSLVATLNHDVSRLLGRYPTTLHTEDRSDGVAWECELPNGPTGQDVREAVARGDLNGTSWRMVVGRDRWEGNVRVVEEIRELRDVAVVTHPAYPTAVELRSLSNENENENTNATELAPEEATMDPNENEETTVETTEETTTLGGLTVEERSADPALATNIESRVLDAMSGVPRGESRDLTTADASAGPVTPPQLSTYMWDLLRDRAIVLASGVPVITTSNKTVKWPRLVADITADFFDELDEIDESDPGFDEFEVDPKAIKALVRGSSEAFDDSDPDLLTIVRQNLETILALKLDRELLIGNAAKGFKGMANAVGIDTMDAAGVAANYDVFVKAAGVLAGKHVPGPYAIATHPWVETHFGLLKTTIGETLQRPDGVPPFATTTQIGHDDGDGTASAIVYAPRQLAVVRRQDVEILVDRSQEFTKDAVLVRGKIRATLFLPYPQAVVRVDNLPAPDPSV
jgi:HK97 family phage major capsid protein